MHAALLQQKRGFVPVLLAGVGLAGAAYLVSLTSRAYRRMQEEEGGGPSDSATGEGPKAAADVLARVLGLDLGTTFAKIAQQDRSNKSLELLVNREGKRSTPMYFYRSSPDEPLQIGAIARNARFVKAQNVSQRGFVSLFNIAEAPNWPLGLEGLSLDDLIKALTKDLVKSVAAKQDSDSDLLGRTVAILTAPNNFSAEASDRLVNAVRSAGIDCVGSIPNAVAAVKGAAKTLGPSKRSSLLPDGDAKVTIFVVDVGGLTTQLSLVQAEEGGQKLTLVKDHTVPFGGDHFDEAVVKHLVAEFAKGNKGLDLLKDTQSVSRLHEAAETAKHELSTSFSSKISLPFITATQAGPLHLEATLSRTQLERLISLQVDEIREGIKKVLFSSAATAPLKGILLCGGGARMPCFTRVVQEVTGGLEPILAPSPDEVCALGAAGFIDE